MVGYAIRDMGCMCKELPVMNFVSRSTVAMLPSAKAARDNLFFTGMLLLKFAGKEGAVQSATGQNAGCCAYENGFCDPARLSST